MAVRDGSGYLPSALRGAVRGTRKHASQHILTAISVACKLFTQSTLRLPHNYGIETFIKAREHGLQARLEHIGVLRCVGAGLI